MYHTVLPWDLRELLRYMGKSRRSCTHILLRCNGNGNLGGAQISMEASQGIAIIATTVDREAGIMFDSAAKDAILSDGIDGVISPRLIREIRLLRKYAFFRPNEFGFWNYRRP